MCSVFGYTLHLLRKNLSSSLSSGKWSEDKTSRYFLDAEDWHTVSSWLYCEFSFAFRPFIFTKIFLKDPSNFHWKLSSVINLWSVLIYSYLFQLPFNFNHFYTSFFTQKTNWNFSSSREVVTLTLSQYEKKLNASPSTNAPHFETFIRIPSSQPPFYTLSFMSLHLLIINNAPPRILSHGSSRLRPSSRQLA